MDFGATTPASGAAITTTNSSAASTMMNLNNNSNISNTLPPPLIPTQQHQSQHQLQATTTLLNPLLVDYNQSKSMMPPALTVPQPPATSARQLENFMIYDNFDVHESHRIEDGICTNLSRLPPKKQELLKQFGIQANQTVTYYEKYILIENFNRFCNEYKVADHRPFLDLSDSGLPKPEQLKFIRYLGQGLPNLTLNKLYLMFKDLLGLSRIEKMSIEGYNLDAILKKKKRNLYNRMTAAAVHKECNPDVPTPAPPKTVVTPQPSSTTTAAAKLATAPATIYHQQQQDSYKT